MRQLLRAFLIACATAATGASANEAYIPAPRATIYPGDLIQDNMIDDIAADDGAPAGVARYRHQVVGLVARRTLFTGQPIVLSALESRNTIANGGLVQIVYELPGISISASGLALQAGRVGDAIRVRNIDSGLAVTGVVSSAGTVLVGK